MKRRKFLQLFGLGAVAVATPALAKLPKQEVLESPVEEKVESLWWDNDQVLAWNADTNKWDAKDMNFTVPVDGTYHVKFEVNINNDGIITSNIVEYTKEYKRGSVIELDGSTLVDVRRLSSNPDKYHWRSHDLRKIS